MRQLDLLQTTAEMVYLQFAGTLATQRPFAVLGKLERRLYELMAERRSGNSIEP